MATITLQQLIVWRNAIEPVGHLKSIQIDGTSEYLGGAEVVAISSTFHEIDATIALLSKKVEIGIEVPA